MTHPIADSHISHVSILFCVTHCLVQHCYVPVGPVPGLYRPDADRIGPIRVWFGHISRHVYTWTCLYKRTYLYIWKTIKHCWANTYLVTSCQDHTVVNLAARANRLVGRDVKIAAGTSVKLPMIITFCSCISNAFVTLISGMYVCSWKKMQRQMIIQNSDKIIEIGSIS